jgi:hypothetical protein
MSLRPSWSYVQARLQARHGERLTEDAWRALEAARSPDHFIDRWRTTALRRFSERLNAGMSSHAIERALRNGWRDYVAEVASWCPPGCRPAILWCAPLPDLPSFAALLRGEAPRWVQEDAVLAAFFELAQGATMKSPLAALLPGPEREPTLTGRWYAHWRSLWPLGARECRTLTALADTVKAHVARLDLAGPQDTSAAYRRAFAQAASRMFRRHGASPIAVFCHLALVALDLERLRGGLVRRALFAPAKEAA